MTESCDGAPSTFAYPQGLAKQGFCRAYAKPILHTSDRASSVTHRQVLQVDYAVGGLSDGLRWLGVWRPSRRSPASGKLTFE